jgi:hypothetical protein
MVQYIVLGNVGSDAGYYVFRDGVWEHVGGWDADTMTEIQTGLAVLKAAAGLKTPELADTITSLVAKMMGPELEARMADGPTVLIA